MLAGWADLRIWMPSRFEVKTQQESAHCLFYHTINPQDQKGSRSTRPESPVIFPYSVVKPDHPTVPHKLSRPEEKELQVNENRPPDSEFCYISLINKFIEVVSVDLCRTRRAGPPGTDQEFTAKLQFLDGHAGNHHHHVQEPVFGVVFI